MKKKHPDSATQGDVILTHSELTFNKNGYPRKMGIKNAPYVVVTDKFDNILYPDYYCWVLVGPEGVVLRFFHRSRQSLSHPDRSEVHL